MDAIEMSRAEARDLLILLERLEIKTTDVDLLFQIDGFIRILMDRIFPNLLSDEDRARERPAGTSHRCRDGAGRSCGPALRARR